MLDKVISLYPGLGLASFYTIIQRVFKFGGQPIVKDYLKSLHPTKSDTLLHACAGAIIGAVELGFEFSF